jgi:hypothetical protein
MLLMVACLSLPWVPESGGGLCNKGLIFWSVGGGETPGPNREISPPPFGSFVQPGGGRLVLSQEVLPCWLGLSGSAFVLG